MPTKFALGADIQSPTSLFMFLLLQLCVLYAGCNPLSNATDVDFLFLFQPIISEFARSIVTIFDTCSMVTVIYKTVSKIRGRPLKMWCPKNI